MKFRKDLYPKGDYNSKRAYLIFFYAFLIVATPSFTHLNMGFGCIESGSNTSLKKYLFLPWIPHLHSKFNSVSLIRLLQKLKYITDIK